MLPGFPINHVNAPAIALLAEFASFMCERSENGHYVLNYECGLAKAAAAAAISIPGTLKCGLRWYPADSRAACTDLCLDDVRPRHLGKVMRKFWEVHSLLRPARRRGCDEGAYVSPKSPGHRAGLFVLEDYFSAHF